MIYIYGLYDPRDNQLRYVGKTINLEGRLRSHIDWARDDISCPKSDWIKELLELRLEPIISILEETDEEGWADAERKWIADSRAKGLKIFNVADGGPNPPDWMGRKQSIYHVRKRVEARQSKGNYHHSEETKRMISEKKKQEFLDKPGTFFGKHHTEETKEKIRAKNKNWRPTDEMRKKASEKLKQNPTRYWKGKQFSEEHKQKLSKASKGRKMPLEVVEKARQRMLGSHLSEETKEKLRQANLGRHHSDETKQKLSLLSKGRTKSQEAIEKLREANKNKWQDPEYKAKMKEMRKKVQQENWDNPEYKAKMLEAQKRRREREAKEKGAGQC